MVDVELYMQYRNDGDVPLIVFKPDDKWWSDPFTEFLGQTRVGFLRNFPSTTGKAVDYTHATKRRAGSCDDYKYSYKGENEILNSFITRIDLPAPASSLTVVEPGGYYQFREVITLETGFTLDVKVGHRIRKARPRPEYPAFRVEYHLSVKNHQKGEGLLKNLQQRWKSFGYLVLDSGGDFTVTSEPIISRTTE